MAIVTKRLNTFSGGLCTWELDYDNVTLKLKTLRCTNNYTGWVAIGDFRSSADPTFKYTVEVTTAESPFTQSIPVAVQNKYNITIDANGRMDGVDNQSRMRPE